MKGKLRNYEIQHKLGSGSYGVIYKAINKIDKSVCVLKQIKLTRLNEKAKKNAVNEATILGKLSHPFIVQYIDSFIEDSCLNIIMEYCDGGDLSQFLKLQSKKPLKEDKIWKLFLQICIGLQHIHQRKILHRDIKTLNIFLHQEQVKIGDLGVAKMLEQRDFAQTMVGTPFYLSPQLCEQKPYNQKSDVWALGCMLYELCTYRHPFEATNQAGLILKIIRGKYNPIPEFYSKDLRDLIDSCLQRDYKRRPTAQMILAKTKIKELISSYKLDQVKAIQRILITPTLKQQSKEKDKDKDKDKKQPLAKNEGPQKNFVDKIEKIVPIQDKPNENKNLVNKMAGPPKLEAKRQEPKKVQVPLPKKIQTPFARKQENPFIAKPDSAHRQRQEPIIREVQVKQHILLSEIQVPPPVIIKSEKKPESKKDFLNNLQKHLQNEENAMPAKQTSIYYEIQLNHNHKSEQYKSDFGKIKKYKNEQKVQISHPPLPPKQVVTRVKMEKPVQAKVYDSNKNINKSRGIIKSGGFLPEFKDQKPQSKDKVPQQTDNSRPILGRKQSLADGSKERNKQEVRDIKDQNSDQFQSERNLKHSSISITTPVNPKSKAADADRYLPKKNIPNAPLPPRVRKGSTNQMARNARNQSQRSHNVTKEERDQVMNLPDVVSNTKDDSSDQQSYSRNTHSQGRININTKFNFQLEDIDNKLIVQKYEELMNSKKMGSEEDEQTQHPFQAKDDESDNQQDAERQNFEQQILQQQNYDEDQGNHSQQQEEVEVEEEHYHSEGFINQSQLYEVNKFNLQNAETMRYNQQQQEEQQQQESYQQMRQEIPEQNCMNDQCQWEFDEEPQLPMLQQTQSPFFEEVNPYLIEEKTEEETLQDKKNYLQIKLQENIKRQDQINRLMQIKINQCKALVPKSFDQILVFFREKLNMDQQYTQQDEKEIENFLKRKGLTDNRKFQNIYKIMHFEMELENTRKIIQRICKRLSELQH